MTHNPSSEKLIHYQSMSSEPEQGHIGPPKAARGHATSYSARIDGIVLSVTKNNVSG